MRWTSLQPVGLMLLALTVAAATIAPPANCHSASTRCQAHGCCCSADSDGCVGCAPSGCSCPSVCLCPSVCNCSRADDPQIPADRSIDRNLDLRAMLAVGRLIPGGPADARGVRVRGAAQDSLLSGHADCLQILYCSWLI